MSIKVQKYVANLAKSVAYSTADVLSQKFETINDFKKENQEVFAQIYSSVKDYRASFTRLKKAITNNKVVDAARVGFDSIVYSVTTGDFYAKSKENEVLQKYGGALLSDFDIDSDDFDFGNEGVSDGDKVIATAVKKNSKIGTAITTEAIVKTGKAQMDVSKENTMLLYTQNERLINKLDGGLENIMGFLKQSGEQNAKVQNQMNENLNKFMTSVDNNVMKLTKQMDELLEMQRNIYKANMEDQQQNGKKKIGWDDIITSSGAINIKEYAKHIKKNAFNQVNDAFGVSMLFGEGVGGEGSNMLAQFAANPFRSLMTAGIDKALGKRFNDAAKQLNTTLSNIVPDLIARANSYGKKDSGIASFLGKIFGIKPGESADTDLSKYKKGPIPFDGVTKRSIVEVIPTYLRKILSSVSGQQELIYDFNNGRWTTMVAAQKAVHDTLNNGKTQTANLLRGIIREGTGRDMAAMYAKRSDYKSANQALESLASKVYSAGSIFGLNESDLSSTELTLYRAIKKIFEKGIEGKNGKGGLYTTIDGRQVRIEGRVDAAGVDKKLKDIWSAHQSGMKTMNSSDLNTARYVLAMSDVMGNVNPNEYFGKTFKTNKHGDMDERQVQELPVSQALIRAKDEYGYTLYQYLRNLAANLDIVRTNSDYLRLLNNRGGGGGGRKKRHRGPNNGNPPGFTPSSLSHDIVIDWNGTKQAKYMAEYYKDEYERKAGQNESNLEDKYKHSLEEFRKKLREKGYDDQVVDTITSYVGENGEAGISRLVESHYGSTEAKAIVEYEKKQAEAKKKKWKTAEEWIGKGRVDKLKKLDEDFKEDDGFKKNMSKAKTVTEKLFILGKYISSKTSGSVSDKAADTIIKVDSWLRRLIYGEQVKPDDQKKSFLELMKGQVKEYFEQIKEKISEGFDWIKEKMRPITEPIKEFFGKIFGKVDSEGNVEQNGLFAPFMSGLRRGLAKNSKDVYEWTKEQARIKKQEEEAAERAANATESSSETGTSYAGGVNLTGRAFKSVLSPGEYLNGRKVNKLGVYSIPKGGTVVNPAPAHVRTAQGVIEKAYRDRIATNAEADNELTPLPTIEDIMKAAEASGNNMTREEAANLLIKAEEERKAAQKRKEEHERKQAEAQAQFEKISKTDWAALEDDEQRSIFLGNLASRGLLGGAIGLLAGGPILGAAIGAASTLSKSTNGFANFIFGTAEKDKNGNTLVDENGNVKREANGLISEKMLKAVPDIKKLGAAGLIGGLITPLGPLGGILIGSALGYAKNSDTFQGTIFGEDGIFSKKNTDKLKKGAKNIGAGAIIGALAMPGPFGLIGSALIGATAGYVTSTNKFKDFLLGEEGEDGKRKGGVMGVLKDQVLNPLKDFGSTITDKLMDEIFGAEGDDGKRNGDDGLFGAIRANVIRPISQGAKSIFKEFTNKLVDIGDFAKDTWRKFKYSAAGNDIIGGVFEKATGLTTGLIHGATNVGKVLTKPFRLLGDEGIGGRLKAKRIRTGRADDMTARERLMYRGKLGMAETDAWSGTDSQLASMSRENMSLMLNVLDYDANQGDIDKLMNGAYTVLGQGLRELIPRRDVKKILVMMKNGRIRDVERFVQSRNYTDEVKSQVMSLIAESKTKIDKAQQEYENIANSKMSAQEYLLHNGINVDISDEKKKRSLFRMAKREMAHFESGLTNEEKEWQKQHDFWAGKESPLNPIQESTSAIETTLKGIYYELSGNAYEKKKQEIENQLMELRETGAFTPEELAEKRKMLYSMMGSKSDYVNKFETGRRIRAGRIIEGAIASNDTKKLNATVKFGNATPKSIREGHFFVNDIINDYLPFYTGHLKDTMSPDNRLDYLNSQFDSIMSTACSMFDMLALKELAKAEAVDSDIKLRMAKFKNQRIKNNTLNRIESLNIKNIQRDNIIIVGNGNNTYTFSMTYDYVQGTVTPTENQPDSFNNEKQRFVLDYLKAHVPEEVAEESYMSFGKMIKTSLKFGAYFSAAMVTGISVPVLDYLIKHRKELGAKVKAGAQKLSFEAKQLFGSHDIDNTSFTQRVKNKKYREQAEKEWYRELIRYTKIIKDNNIEYLNDEADVDKYGIIPHVIAKTFPEDTAFKADYYSYSDSDKDKIMNTFISMYVDAKINGQSFGRGMIGTTKHILKKVRDKTIGKISKKFKSIIDIVNESKKGDYQEKAERLRESLEKRAEGICTKVFDPYFYWEFAEKGDIWKKLKKEYGKYINVAAAVIAEINPDRKGRASWDIRLLSPEQYQEFKQIFVPRYVNGRYNELLKESNNETFIDKVRKGVTKFFTNKGRKISVAKDELVDKVKNAVVFSAVTKAIKKGDTTVNKIAIEQYQKTFNELTDSEQMSVARIWYSQYGGLKGKLHKITFAGSSAMGTLKSGIKNSLAGKLDYAKQKKAELQAQDTFIARILDRLDARQLKKDKENFKGKKDSRLSKILKWLFVGGIAVPLIVGFVKQDLLPVIHEKIQPWLKKAKDKIFGVKDETTGEYKGGIISGIVNPIRNLFKSKLDKIHNWIHNEGEYASEDRGLSGFWNSLCKVGSHLVDLWKVGFKEVYSNLAPKILYAVGKNLLPGAWQIIKGLGASIVDGIKGKKSSMDIDFGGDTGKGIDPLKSKSIKIPNTVGGMITVSTGSDSATTIGSKSTITTANGGKLEKKITNEGVTYTNEKGQSVSSTREGDYYSVGTNDKGQVLYKDNKTNKVFVKDEATNSYIPFSDYERLYNENLAENAAFDYQQQVENANELQADYTGSSTTGKVIGTGVQIGRRAGELVALTGARGVKSLTGASRATSAVFGGIGKIPFFPTKVVGKLGKGASKLGGAAIKPVSNIYGKAMNAIGRTGDRLTGGTFTKLGARSARKAEKAFMLDAAKVTKKAAKEAAEKAAKETAAERAAREAAENAAKKAAREAAQQATEEAAEKAAKEATEKATENATKDGGFIRKAIDFIKKSVNKIKNKISEVLKNSKVQKILGKGMKDKADDIAEGVAKTTVKTLEDNTDEIVKKGSTVAGKGVAKVLSVVMIAFDFISGVDNCRNILGIVNPNPSFLERLAGGLINIIPDVLMTLAEAISVMSGGLAAVGGVALAGLSIVATICLSIDSIRDTIVSGIINILDAIGFNMEGIKKEREEAKAAVQAYNAKNNSNVSIEEYNNIIGNKTLGTKIGETVSNGWSALMGYDSGAEKAIRDKTGTLEVKGKSDKIAKQMSTIFSSVWQHFEDDFNITEQYDSDGNALTGDKKLNANKIKFTEVTTAIIKALNGLVIADTEETISQIYSNTCDFTGFFDARFHLKNVYNEGKDNPKAQFKVSDEHASWNRIRAIAGICAIVKEIYAPLCKPWDVTSIVVDCMLPAYFSTDERQKLSGMAVANTAKYNIDQYINEYAGNDQSTDNSGNKSAVEQVATNANANDKLSGFNGNNNFQDMLADNINNSIKSITGGLTGIGDIIKELTMKNLPTNKKIDKLELLPTDDDYWKIETDPNNPFASSMYTFMEQINRVVKAPFALAASMNASTAMNIVTASTNNTASPNASASTNNNTSTSSSDNSAAATTNNQSKGIFGKIVDGAKSVFSSIKGFLFGKGNDGGRGADGVSDASDPFHIYQRQFNGSYNTAGDRERQTVADSGCGPASAASVLRMYGKEGNMNNAVRYALNNKYKEKDGGTYPQYFSDYFAKNGISSNPNASNAEVINSLMHGKPVVLMGQDRSGSKKTPYGSKYSHYVVARGIDRNGNVIVEDSEDRKGSTRYSLADTLRNTSVRITTNKYGRGDGSVGSAYVGNTSSVMTAMTASMLAQYGIADTSSGSYVNTTTDTTSSRISDSSGYIGTGDASKMLGKKLSMKDKYGRTFSISITEDEAELYDMLTNKGGFNSACACGIIANWECECGINRIRKVACKGRITDGGGLMQWTPPSKHVAWANKNGYSNDPWSWEANKAHALEMLMDNSGSSGNWWKPKSSKPSLQSQGFTPVSNMKEFRNITDVESAAVNYERVFEGSFDWNGKTTEKGKRLDPRDLYDYKRRLYGILLYNLIVNGKSDDNGGMESSGSGRGKTEDIIMTSSGRGKYGRDGETTTTTAAAPETSTTESTDTTPVSSDKKEPGSKGLISLISNYATRLTRGVFGNFYDALYGDQTSSTTTTNDGYVGDTTSSGPLDIDSENTIICGDSITKGLHLNSPMGDRALGLGSGGTLSYKHKTSDGTYESVFKAHADVIRKATNVIFFWGMNELKPGMDREEYVKVYKKSIDTILGYAGKTVDNCNVYIMSVDPIPEKTTYNISYADVISYNDYYAKWVAHRYGFPYIDIHDACLERQDKKGDFFNKSGDIHPNSQALYEVIKEVTSSNSEGGSGRGKAVAKKYSGRAKYGRDVEENNTSTTTTQDISTTDEPVTTVKTALPESKTLISKIGKYAKDSIKGVYGNFYDALYGNEATNDTSADDGLTSSGAVYKGGDVVYAAAMVFEALYKADPTLRYDNSFGTLHTLVCRDGTKLEHQRPDCSGMMCAVLHYMGYYTTRYKGWSYSDTFHGTGWDLGAIKVGCNIGDYIFNDEDGTPTKDWIVMAYDPNDRQPGDIRFHSGHRHTDMFIFSHNGHDYGVNAGSGDCGKSIGNGMYNSYIFSKFYLDNGRLPNSSEFSAHASGKRGTVGAWCIQPNETRCVLRYIGKQGSGRGKSKNASYIKNTIGAYSDAGKISDTMMKAVYDSEAGAGFGYGKAVRSRGGKGIFDTTSKATASTTPVTSSSTSSSSRVSDNRPIDLMQIIELVKVIAENSDKMNAMLALLGTIATNTEGSASTSDKTNEKIKPAQNNALSALRSALSASGSGEDIINAVYKIAKA